jgi:hypothetical protein
MYIVSCTVTTKELSKEHIRKSTRKLKSQSRIYSLKAEESNKGRKEKKTKQNMRHIKNIQW